MSGRVIILDSQSDDSSSDSIPSPSPFSPEYRRPRPPPADENEAPPPAKRQRVSVLEQQESEDPLLSESNAKEANGSVEKEQEDVSFSRSNGKESTVLEKKETETSLGPQPQSDKEERRTSSSREGDTEDRNKTSVLERTGDTAAMPRIVSDEDRKQQAKEKASPPLQRDEESKGPDTGSGDSKDEVVSKHVQLPELPTKIPPLDPLSEWELSKLKQALQFDANDPDEEWPAEWSGNLSLLTLEVTNPLNKSDPSKGGPEHSLIVWALTSPTSLSLARSLLRYVYNAEGTPPTAKRILAHTYHQSIQDPTHDMEPAAKRLSFDPAVLREDGWTTAKSAERVGVTGGPYNIGMHVYWEKWAGIVIAYVHDSDIGDLWKAMWFEGNETFDLEAEELQKARKAWERKYAKPQIEQPQAQGSSRFASVAKFTVEGIENGIVMAKTYNPKARHGLFWPARVMHLSEIDRSQLQSRRSSAKQKLQIIFLAPYWNGEAINTSRLALADSLSLGTSAFSSGPLFEVETIDVSEETIQPYPYSGEHGLNVDELQVAFRFTGLPKNAFGRFLDSHRLALALKTYAQQDLALTSTHSHAATAALTDTHALAIETAKFPIALLHLPFQYILSNLPHATEKDSLTMGRNEDNIEPTIQLRHIMKSMEPPSCWGQEIRSPANNNTPHNGLRITPALSAALTSPAKHQIGASGSDGTSNSMPVPKIDDVASEYLIQALSSSASMASKLLEQLTYLLTRLKQEVAGLEGLSISQRRKKLLLFLKVCLRTKVSLITDAFVTSRH